MKCEENALREVLSSVHGGEAGQSIWDRVKNGEQVSIAMVDGTTLALTDPVETLRVLLECFDWKRRIDWSDDRTAAYVLGICQRVERRFTLREVVARIALERPEAVLEFASAWGRLIQHKFIRVIKSGEASIYEVADAHAWP
jgi:hypothetical protein